MTMGPLDRSGEERLLRRRRCIVATRAACDASTSVQNRSWKRSWMMYRSVVPSLRGTGRNVSSPSVLPGKSSAS